MVKKTAECVLPLPVGAPLNAAGGARGTGRPPLIPSRAGLGAVWASGVLSKYTLGDFFDHRREKLWRLPRATLDELPVVPRAIARTRRRSNAPLWILAIVGSPVWIPLLLAFVAVAAAVYVCIWILALCVWIVAVALGGVGVVELVFAVGGVVVGHVPYVFASVEAGLAILGLALLVGTSAWAASKQIARLSAFWARKAASPFWKDRGNKSSRSAEAAPLAA